MSFDSFLNRTCTINRPTANVMPDRYNQSQYSGVTVGADVRCRLVEKNVKVLDAKTSEHSWVKATVLLLPTGTDVQPKDEVTVGDDVWQVMQALSRSQGAVEHHVSVIVEALNV